MAKRKKEIQIPKKFVPQFWDSEDGRSMIVREIRQRYETLKEDCGADSYQKEMLVQRAIFIGLQLETMEVEAATKGIFDPAVYTQMVNALSGLLNKLGLDRKPAKAATLQAYVSGGGK